MPITQWSAVVHAAGVVGRAWAAAAISTYALRMFLYPAERWTGGLTAVLVQLALACVLMAPGGAGVSPGVSPASRPKASLERLSPAVLGYLLLAGVITAWFLWVTGPSAVAAWLGIRRSHYAVRIERGVPIHMRDGTPLVADIFHPQRAEKTPTALVRTAQFRTAQTLLHLTTLGRLWAERGYTVVVQGVRGRFGSGGQFYPLRHERQDGADTIAWLERQPWYDGRIETWGGGYAGFAQWSLGQLASVQVHRSASDYYAALYPGGALAFEAALYWAMAHRERGSDASARAMRRGPRDFPLIEADERGGGDVGFFNDWVRHSARDEYWESVNPRVSFANLRAPVLLVAGWFDAFLPSQLADWDRLQRDAPREVAEASRLVIGPWAHNQDVVFPAGAKGPTFLRESVGPSVAWFDRRPHSAKVRYFVMGVYQWHEADEWPPAGAQQVSWYLRSGGRANTTAGDGRLTREPPHGDEPSDIFDYNPRQPVPSTGGALLTGSAIARQNDIESRPDVIVYSSDALAQDIAVAGPMAALIHVATYAPSTDFTARLVDVHPDGASYNVSDGILRRRYFESNKPEGWSPVTEIRIDLWPTAVVFRKGHRIRLQVSSSNYPRFDRNPNTGEDPATARHTEAVRQAVHHGLRWPSRLVLPVVPQ